MNNPTRRSAPIILAALVAAPMALAQQGTPPAQNPPKQPPAPAPSTTPTTPTKPASKDDLTNPIGNKPAAQPSAPAAATPTAPGAEKPAAPLDTSAWKVTQAGPLMFKAPPTWETEVPAQSMFTPLAQFKLAGEAGKPGGQLKVFGGIGGGVGPNIQRWIGQVTAPVAPPKTTELTVNGLKVTQVELTGTFAGMAMAPNAPAAQPQAETTLLGAIVETADGDIQFKLVGPKDVVAKNRPQWDAMIKTIMGPK